MTPQLTDELREALRQSGGTVEVQDDQSDKVYVLTESDVFHRAMQALQAQEDLAAIQAGAEALEAGAVLTLDAARRNLRSDAMSEALEAGAVLTLDELDIRIRSRLASLECGT